jgi:hypothetical protein
MGVPLNIDVQMYVQAENEGKNSEKALEISKLEEQNIIVDTPVDESLNTPFKDSYKEPVAESYDNSYEDTDDEYYNNSYEDPDDELDEE